MASASAAATENVKMKLLKGSYIDLLKLSDGYGDGDGYAYGDGYSDGDGFGFGSGYGHNRRDGHGYGHGHYGYRDGRLW